VHRVARARGGLALAAAAQRSEAVVAAVRVPRQVVILRRCSTSHALQSDCSESAEDTTGYRLGSCGASGSTTQRHADVGFGRMTHAQHADDVCGGRFCDWGRASPCLRYRRRTSSPLSASPSSRAASRPAACRPAWRKAHFQTISGRVVISSAIALTPVTNVAEKHSAV